MCTRAVDRRGRSPGARFKRRAGHAAFNPSAKAALFDDEGLVAAGALGRVVEAKPGVMRVLPWGSFELLTAPRAKGEVARLRGSADGTFSVYANRPLAEEYDVTRFSTEEPDEQAFSFSSDIDVTLCSDIVEAR